MSDISRRQLLAHAGLAVAGSGLLVLRADAKPTASVHHDDIEDSLPRQEMPQLPDSAQPTHVIRSPYYHPGAPWRAKMGLPMDAGPVLVVTGRVWAFDTKRPLSNAVMELFQVDSQGVYAMQKGDYRNRVRFQTDETGAYELETLHPVGYFLKDQTGKKFRFRRPHIHYEVRAPGYKILATELYFDGDKDTEEGMFDDWAHKSLVMPIDKVQGRTGSFEKVVFDLVLEPGEGYKGGT
jgi:protocatechuate 3,4-dioxygenase beta subunit